MTIWTDIYDDISSSLSLRHVDIASNALVNVTAGDGIFLLVEVGSIVVVLELAVVHPVPWCAPANVGGIHVSHNRLIFIPPRFHRLTLRFVDGVEVVFSSFIVETEERDRGDLLLFEDTSVDEDRRVPALDPDLQHLQFASSVEVVGEVGVVSRE